MATRIKNNQPVQHWMPQWHSGGCFGLVGCCVFCGGSCFFKGKKTINLFGFGGLGGMEVVVVGGILVFLLRYCTFLLFYVLWHCTLCRSIALSAVALLCATVQFFVPQGCFCAAVSCFVPWQCDWCCGVVLCVMALHFVPQHCAVALCFMSWHFL